MRAPPDWLTVTKGILSSRANRHALAIFSPTTDPIEPPMKEKSIAAIAISIPSSRPTAVTTASLFPADSAVAIRFI